MENLKKSVFYILTLLLIATIFVAELRLVIIHSAEFFLNRPLNISFWDPWIQTRTPFLLGIFLFFILIRKNYVFKTDFLNHFLEFIFKNRWSFLIGFGTLLLIYARQLHVLNARIDVQILINNNPGIPTQLYLGRYGDYITRLIFEGNDFNPYYSSLLAFLFVGFSLILFAYLCQKIANLKPAFSTAIFCFFMVHPVWIEQYYFNHQILEVNFALFLIFLTLVLIYKITFLKRSFLLIFIVPLFVWIYATYQSLIILYFAATLFFFLIHFATLPPPPRITKLRRNSVTVTDLDSNEIQIAWRFGIYAAIVFVVGYILNEIITRIYLGGSLNYFKDQVCWGKKPFNICATNIVSYFYYTVLSGILVYGASFFISSALLLISLRFSPRPRAVFILTVIFLQITPFIIILYSGAMDQAVRSQMTLPFVIAANFALTLLLLPSKTLSKTIIGVIAFIIFLIQANVVLRLQYTDDLRFQNDLLLINNVEQRVALLGGTDLPLAVVGVHPARLNNVSKVGHLIGLPNNGEIHNVGHSLGISFRHPSQEQQQRANAEAKAMPVFPADGSVKNMGDFIVVKLGEPLENTTLK